MFRVHILPDGVNESLRPFRDNASHMGPELFRLPGPFQNVTTTRRYLMCRD